MSQPNPKFYEIVAKSTDVVELLFYGFIGRYEEIDDKVFARDWKTLEGKYKKATIRVNSGGGSVFSGIAIYNLIKQSSLEVTIIIDGLAGSMASVIILSAPLERREMAANARIMTHKPSGGGYGSAQQLRQMADTIDGLEDTMAEVYAEATGKTLEEAKAWMKEGVDKYFNAKEAKDANLIGKIIGGSSAKAPSSKLTEEAALYEHFSMCLSNKTTKTPFHTMNKIVLMAALAAAGYTAKVLTEESSDADFMAALTSLLQAKDQAIADLKARLDKSEGDKVTALIDQAVASGKILPTSKASFEALAKSDFANTAKILEAMPGKASITATIGAGSAQEAGEQKKANDKADQSTWDFGMWRKEDPRGLERMLVADPDGHEKLKQAYLKNKK
jgi:ATP-dependent Clp endopeptidase proteolytic subunit ClpP